VKDGKALGVSPPHANAPMEDYSYLNPAVILPPRPSQKRVMVSHRQHSRGEDEREEGDRQEQIGFGGMKLEFGMSDLPPSGELIIAHLNTSVGYDPDRLQCIRPSSLTRPPSPHDSEYQEEG
jgi:hypothetical protein